MGLLGALGLGAVTPRLGVQVLRAVELRDPLPGRLDGLVAQVHRVRAHVGDVAVLVEALGDLHGLLGAHA